MPALSDKELQFRRHLFILARITPDYLEFDHIHEHHNYMNMISTFEKVLKVAFEHERQDPVATNIMKDSI